MEDQSTPRTDPSPEQIRQELVQGLDRLPVEGLVPLHALVRAWLAWAAAQPPRT